jgi:hypothetical protein
MKYKFRDLVFEPPYAPYYDSYRGHVFVIDHYSEEDESKQHVWLTCASDPDIIVEGYVELYQLEE